MVVSEYVLNCRDTFTYMVVTFLWLHHFAWSMLRFNLGIVRLAVTWQFHLSINIRKHFGVFIRLFVLWSQCIFIAGSVSVLWLLTELLVTCLDGSSFVFIVLLQLVLGQLSQTKLLVHAFLLRKYMFLWHLITGGLNDQVLVIWGHHVQFRLQVRSVNVILLLH